MNRRSGSRANNSARTRRRRAIESTGDYLPMRMHTPAAMARPAIICGSA
jgi:hypothetical protein